MENPARRSFRKFHNEPAEFARRGQNNDFIRPHIVGIMPAFPQVADNGL